MTSIDTTWLKEVCSKEKERDYLSRPMRFFHEGKGKHYTIATDGRRLVEIPGVHEPLPDPHPKIEGNLELYLQSTPKSAVPFNFTLFKHFITRIVTGIKADHEVQAVIGNVLFNAMLFRPMVRHLPDVSDARWSQKNNSTFALVDGREWRFMVMPLRDYLTEAGRAGLPRFDIDGTKAVAA